MLKIEKHIGESLIATERILSFTWLLHAVMCMKGNK